MTHEEPGRPRLSNLVSVPWRLMWPFAVAIAASRILSFPLPGAWNPSVVPAPGVSLLDALIFFCAGYYGSQRTRQFSDGVRIAAATSLFGFIAFLVYAAITNPGLLMAPFEKPFIFLILSALLLIAVCFGIALGMLGAAVRGIYSRKIVNPGAS